MRLSDLSISPIDLRLGLRMLFKYPGLTTVGGLAFAFAVWVGAVTFEVAGQMLAPHLPLDEGDRVVAILNDDLERRRRVAPLESDHVAWERTLGLVTELGRFRDVHQNLIPPGGSAAPIRLAAIDPVGFEVPRVAPILGRGLDLSDAVPGAPAVVVLAFEVWHTRFDADPDIIGSTVTLGGSPSTVVGIMPDGFGFPVSHQGWVPLSDPPSGLQAGEGSPVVVFGRLADGTTIEAAQAELDAVSQRRAQSAPLQLQHLRPRVIAFAEAVSPLPDIGPLGVLAANTFALMLFVLICGSVALLVWARAATRSRELAVRSALGAGRGRITMQLFTEALVLSSAAAVVGLVAADFGVAWYADMVEADAGSVPFWMSRGVTFPTIGWVAGLTLVGAMLVGLVPAVQVSGRNVDARIRRAERTGGLHLKGTWGKVIVAQIAVTAAFPATAFFSHRYVVDIRSFDVGLTGNAYVTARLDAATSQADAPGSPNREQSQAERYTSLHARLLRHPDVAGVTFAQNSPGSWAPQHPIDIEVGGAVLSASRRVGAIGVDFDFFRSVGAPIVAGRGFSSADTDETSRAVVVNEAFVESILKGRSAVGRRFRLRQTGRPGSWLEIVGVVGNLAMLDGEDFVVEAAPGFYHAVSPEAATPLHLLVALQGGTYEAFVPALRDLAAHVDPSLVLHDVRDPRTVGETLWRETEFLYRVLAGISAVALIMSLAVIYTLLSLTVSLRTKEIGVRRALGANPRRIIRSMFGSPARHVGLGVSLGSVLVVFLTFYATGSVVLKDIVSVGLYAAAMFGVCALACVAPTRRALNIEPSEALRAE